MVSVVGAPEGFVPEEHANNIIRRNLYPKFCEFADRMMAHVVNFHSASSSEPFSQDERSEASLTKANTISSRVKDDRKKYRLRSTTTNPIEHYKLEGEVHKPVLDLDMPCILLDSSTPGHHHLLIDHEIPWEKYEKLLRVMEECDLLEAGYVEASIARRGSYIRAPWSKK